MSEQNDHRRLLSDILSEEGDANFRESLLLHTLSLARRRRKQRQLRRAASALLLIAGLGLLLWRTVPPRAPLPRAPRPYALIETRPLPPTALVKTEPLPAALVITSVPTEHVVSTIAAQKIYREIDDRQLFALAPAPLILIRHGNSAEVVFADPADQEKFLRN